MTKRESNSIKFLRLMSDGRWHTNGSLANVCGYRFGARKWELIRAWGISVEKRTIGEDQWEYRWTDDAATRVALLGVVSAVRGAVPVAVEPKQGALAL